MTLTSGMCLQCGTFTERNSIDAFNATAEQCSQLTYAQLLPLVCNCIRFMADEEMSIRNSATYALLAVLRHIATDDGIN